ncbi:hypothetical protein ACIHDR_45025 [Nocardia sp. NPDC052278]|uniref:hypothetical protein n=1 Tax=unclassified Nocardia TaxID=2637762 RepID=UPI0036773640
MARSQARFRAVAGTFWEVQPSKDTIRYRPNRTPGVDGCANGPASTSNNIRIGATPTRRRKSRNAFAVGAGKGIPVSEAVSLSQTAR